MKLINKVTSFRIFLLDRLLEVVDIKKLQFTYNAISKDIRTTRTGYISLRI